MDAQDQRKTSPPGHESHGVHLCHKCGWPFPNLHPSAKHRRAHKRICGTIEGYKLIDSEEHTHSVVSDNEPCPTEDQRTPSPKIERRSSKEIGSGGVDERSNRSEDEVFSDAVTEFSDSGFSPLNEERVGGARVSDKNVGNVMEDDPVTKQHLKVHAFAGDLQQPDSPTVGSQVHNALETETNPTVGSQVHNALETETNLLGSTTPNEDVALSSNSDLLVNTSVKTDEVVVFGSVNGSACDVSHTKSETLINLPKEDGKEKASEYETQSSKVLLEQQGGSAKGIEESSADEVLSDGPLRPSKIDSESSEVTCKLQELDPETSVSVTLDQVIESTEDQSSKWPGVESCKHVEFLANTALVESDSARDIDGEGNEDFYVCSVAEDIPTVDHPEIMVEDYKGYKTVRSNLPVTLDSDEAIEPLVDANKDTFHEESEFSFHPSKLSESIDLSSAGLQTLEGNVKQEDGGRVSVAEVPIEGEASTSELKVSHEDLGSLCAGAASETTVTGKNHIEIHLEGQQPYVIHTASSEDTLAAPITMGLSDVFTTTLPTKTEVGDKTTLSGGEIAYNLVNDKTNEHDTDGEKNKVVVEEELLTSTKTSPESVNDLSVAKADQSTNLLGTENIGDPADAGSEFSDVTGNKSRDVAAQEHPETNSKLTLESAHDHSASEVVASGLEKFMNLQETETTPSFVVDSSEIGHDVSDTGVGVVALTHSGSQYNLGTSSQETTEESKVNNTNDVLLESIGMACEGVESNDANGAGLLRKIIEILPENLVAESDVPPKSSFVVDENPQEECDGNVVKQPVQASVIDVFVDSSSQTDSVEANWGSVSVFSTQSDALAATDTEALPSPAPEEPPQPEKENSPKPDHSINSDAFEPPSFMTLVEPAEGADQKPAASDTQQPESEGLQAAWFPSLTSVVNDSQGRKKNEEIIAKVTNWSTGKQHTPLKSLLGEADVEPKLKPLNQNPTPRGTKKAVNSTKKNDVTALTVNSVLAPEAATDQVVKREMGKEWNSPARFPSDSTKEKRKVKGRPYWVPFVCCSSGH